MRLGGPGDSTRLRGVFNGLMIGDTLFAITDLAERRVIISDLTGERLRVIGSRGQGPSEFGNLGSLFAVGGDTLGVSDLANGRISLVSTTGMVLEVVPMPFVVDRQRLTYFGWVAGSEYIAWGFSMVRPTASGLYRPEGQVVRVSSDGNMEPSVTMKGPESHYLPDEQWPGVRPLLQKSTSVVYHDGTVYVGDTDRPEILEFGSSGDLQRIVRWIEADGTPSSSDIRNLSDERLAAYSVERRRSIRRRLGDIPAPDRFPAFSQFKVDADGNLWVQAFEALEHERHWNVFDVDGHLMGTVLLPDTHRVLDIGRNHVLAVQLTEMDEEVAVAYEILRN